LSLHRYNTFSGYPPEIVKKMPKRDLAEEVMTVPTINRSVYGGFYSCIWTFIVL